MAFSGRPPSPGGLPRGSRHVPVHVGGFLGSTGPVKCVSLYVITVRFWVSDPSMLFPQRVFQNISLPLKNATLTPAASAASTLSRCPEDQYSSWPSEMNVLWFLSSAPW